MSQNVPQNKKIPSPKGGETGSEDSPLTHRQQAVLPILAVAPSVAEAARQSKLDRRTLHRWLQDDDFRQELQRIRHEAADLARSELNLLMFRSVAALSEFFDDPDRDRRLRAIRTALAYSVKINDIQNLKDQIQTLEDALNFKRS